MTAPEASVAPQSVSRILVVEDDEVIRRPMSRVLEGNRYEVRGSSKSLPIGGRPLKLEALRSTVSPHVADREWDKVLREHWPVRWADQLRLANALACGRHQLAAEVEQLRPCKSVGS